jgi:hypothetical protein
LDAGNPGSTYTWSTGATTQTVLLSSPGTYVVTVTNTFGCEAVDTINIAIGTVPLVDIGADTIICNSGTLTLNAGNPGLTYHWNTGATTQMITVSTASVYIVEVTDPSGCVGTDTITVNVSGTTVSLGPDKAICTNEGALLDASNPTATFLWNTGATTQTIFVSTPGTYTVTVTDIYGCISTDVITLTSAPAITADFVSPATGTLFAPITFSDASGPGTVSWNWDFGDGGSSAATSPSHTFTAFGVYTITQIVSNGTCKDTTEKTIDINNFIGVDESQFASGISVFPNPSSGMVFVQMDLLDRYDVQLNITDMTGRIIRTLGDEGVTSFHGEVDMSQQADGVYLLEMNVSGMRAFRKLVITH